MKIKFSIKAAVLALSTIAALSSMSPASYAFPYQPELPVPETLFHAGRRDNLESDIRAGQLSADVWKNSIFGATNYDLPDYRKGLYGGETVASVNLYFLEQLFEGSEPWIMMIHLPRECRTNQATFFPDGFKMQINSDGSSNPFALWFRDHGEKYKDVKDFCIKDGAWQEGSPYSVKDASPGDHEIDVKCEPALNEFISRRENRVIFDEYNYLPAWYIRDPSCVARIDGTADQLFGALAANVGSPLYQFVENLFGPDSEKSTPVLGSTFFVLKVLAESSRLTPTAKPWLLKVQTDLAGYIPDYSPPEKPKLLSVDDNYYILSRAFGSAARAIADGSVGTFQANLKSWLSKATQEIGAACHGGKGGHVPKDRYQGCVATHATLSAELLAVLK
jgi:hypothetical protein